VEKEEEEERGEERGSDEDEGSIEFLGEKEETCMVTMPESHPFYTGTRTYTVKKENLVVSMRGAQRKKTEGEGE